MIFLCFFLTSTAWLEWEYHLLEQLPARQSDLMTMVAGYLLQGGGIAVFAFLIHRREILPVRLFRIALVLHLIFVIAAVLSPNEAGTLFFGFLLNICCGLIAGYYLYDLTGHVDARCRATTFGAGYGMAVIASWILSLLHGGAGPRFQELLPLLIAITAAAFLLDAKICCADLPDADREANTDREDPSGSADAAAAMGSIVTLGIVILLFSIVNSSGFAFPSSDIGSNVHLEFVRLVYAAGLMIAGIVTDYSRKGGAIIALCALVIPFVLLALRGEELSAAVFWMLGYFVFGFYSVYRIISFSDLSRERGLLYLSGFGLMIGRAGDAAGQAVILALQVHPVTHVIVTAVLFAAAVAVFFSLFQTMYPPETGRELSEQERFYRFAVEHDLSSRERELLHLILDEKTNAEIAAALSISENTVKFHVRNILHKTNCKSRKDLFVLYVGQTARSA